MDSWGNNPATYQAVGAVFSSVGIIAVIIYTYLTWRLFQETKTQRVAIEGEMAARMRPWVGLFACNVNLDFETGKQLDELSLLIKKFGPLPAQRASLSLEIVPLNNMGYPSTDVIQIKEDGAKVLMPAEEGNYKINLSEYQQFLAWKLEKQSFRVIGTYSYSLADLNLNSQFECIVRFDVPNWTNPYYKLNWRNQLAS